MNAVEFRNVDIVFGERRKDALAMVDAGASREAIVAETGCVIGVAGIDLAVPKGEICVLMGLSGSGKSTLLRAVNRLTEVARGEVLVAHEGRSIDVASCDEATLRAVRSRTVSMVFQQFGLLPWRTVRENAGFGLELRGVPTRERTRIVDEKLEMVGLSEWADAYAHELSGGMQQRVGLARAFATDAEVLLMDEPFSSLDPLIRDKLQDDLLDLQRRIQKTIVFVSHDLDEAMKLGNTIAIMEGGRIVQTGSIDDILLRSANGYVAEFVKHTNPLNVLRANSVMTPLADLDRDGTRVTSRRETGLEITVDDGGRPIGAAKDGRRLRLAGDGETGGIDGTGVFVAPIGLTLRQIIALKRRSSLPILLVDERGRLAGLCGDREIYETLDRSDPGGH
jgi:glycine betaine/proline transport system ATP-binding protein